MSDPAPAAPSSAPTGNLVQGILTGIVSAILLAELRRFTGDVFPELWSLPEIVQGIPVLVGFVVAYFVPLTNRELAARTTNAIIKIANADIDNQAVTAKVVSADESDRETAKDVALGVIPADIVAKRPDI